MTNSNQPSSSPANRLDRTWPPPISAYAAARQAQLLERLRRQLETSALWTDLRAWFLIQPERWRRWCTPVRLATLALSAGLTAGVVGQPVVALAQEPVPVGGEFRVNSYTVGTQHISSVGMNDDGDFVIVWENFNSYDIFARRYKANGEGQGTEFQINTYTNGIVPRIELSSEGNFVVTWIGWEEGGSRIYARRYNADGVAQGSEFQVNSNDSASLSVSSVGMDVDGDFIIVWHSFGQDDDSDGIYARRYGSNGTAWGKEFQVSSFTTSIQGFSSVAMDADGNFVIAWERPAQDDTDIYARSYSANGTAQGVEFQVNTYITDAQRFPSVDLNAEGDFVIAWESFNQDGSGYSIYGRRYKRGGIAQGSEFQVNTYITNNQHFPSVGLDRDGDFVIAWQSNHQDSSEYDVFARNYDATGTPQSSEFQVNTYSTDDQTVPSVATDEDDDFIIVWTSDTQDSSIEDIYAQRYGLPQLTLTKTANMPLPHQDQRLTYTLTVDNNGILTATNAVISDTLPAGLTFAGPVTLTGSAGTVADEAADLPTLASGLTIAPNSRITVTLPVTITGESGEITNVAAVTSAEVTTPATGSVTIIIGGQEVYLPLVLKE